MTTPLELLAIDLCMVHGVDRVPRGHLRMETKFRYPDGGSVDLFIIDGPQVPLLAGELVVSDLGQTMSWLVDAQVRPWQSKKRQRFLDDALRALEVRQSGGALEVSCARDHASLEDAVIRLGQACVRAADLTFTRRNSLQVGVTEEVEEILADAELEYEADVQLPGRHGNVVTVDFVVSGRRQRSAVLTLASQHPASAHTSAIEVFRKLYDLSEPGPSEQRVTVFDDRYRDAYKPEDLVRIQEVSALLPLSARKDVAALLAA